MDKISKWDMDVLQRISEGEAFLKRENHQRRADDLVEDGYLEAELALWRMTGGGANAEFRRSYKLTDKGKQALGKSNV